MHTYLVSRGVYTIGMWIATGDSRGSMFSKMFDVADRDAAITAVNMLNGGDTTQKFKVLKEH